MRIFKYLLIMVAGSMLAACSGGGGGGGSSVGTGGGGGATVTMGGKVVDGYVQGARVYIVPIGETTATHARFTSDGASDAQGGYSFTGVSDFLAANSANNQYQFVSIGGTNIATGAPLPADTVYTGPLNTKVLTPVTTLVMKTATTLAGSGAVSQEHINQALAQIAAVSGIDADKAGTTLLSTDPVASAATDSNASKALALQLTITQLATQKVVDGSGSFDATVAALAGKLATGAPPINVVALATSAAAPDAASQARAAIISTAIVNTVHQISVSAQSQSTTSAVAGVMAQMENQLSTNIGAQMSAVTASTDVAAVTAQITNATTTQVTSSVGGSSDKTASAADLQDSAAKSYLLRKASEGGVAQLLGIDVLTVPTGNAVVKSMALNAARLAAAPAAKRKTATSAGANPCSGVANGSSVALSCTDVFGSDFCAGTGNGFQASVSCSNNAPSKIAVTLSAFNSSALGSTLSGGIAIDSSTMTFNNLTNGTTIFNGAVSYAAGSNGSLDLAVKSMTVTSPLWSPLNLDSFSRASITPAGGSTGQDGVTAYISGNGTPAAGGAVQKFGLSYERYQDAVKSAAAQGYSDNVTVKLNGEIRENSDVTTFTNFGVQESRRFAGALDTDYLSKSSVFLSGSKLGTSKYGYAIFSSDGLTFNYDPSTQKPVYQSGTLFLSAQ